MKVSVDRFKTVNFKKLPQTKAWKLTSELIRRRSKGKCYTCGKIFPLNKLNAGHFIEKTGHAGIYFEDDNLRAQCFRCNRLLHGNLVEYTIRLQKEIGQERINKLLKKGNKPKIWTKEELEDIENKREEELEYLKNG